MIFRRFKINFFLLNASTTLAAFLICIDSCSHKRSCRIDMGSPFCSISVGSGRFAFWLRSERLCKKNVLDFGDWKLSSFKQPRVNSDNSLFTVAKVFHEDKGVSAIPATEVQVGYVYFFGFGILLFAVQFVVLRRNIHSKVPEKKDRIVLGSVDKFKI